MKIGLAPTNSDYGPATADMAVEAEQRGYDSLWVGEHSNIPASRETVHPDGGDLPEFYWRKRDPFVSLATAAAATSKIRIAMGVCLVLEHEILDLAKSVATLDEISDGRLLFGVGVGWNREELANVSDVPWPLRYNAMRETVAALRLLWTEHEVEYSGEFVNFAPAWVYPKPAQQLGPPVLVGCRGRIGMRHVAEYADGWCPLDVGFRDVRVGIERFRTAVEAAGRDPDAIPISMYCYVNPDAEKLELYGSLGAERVVLGAPDGADRLARFLDRYQPLVDAFAD